MAFIAATVLVLTYLILGQIDTIAAEYWFFLFLYAATWIFAAVYFITIPKSTGIKQLYLWIFIPAVLCRLALLPFPSSDDVNRYLWEGKILTMGVNPYSVSPDHKSLEVVRDKIWKGINHKNMTAVYPPGSLVFFSILSRINYSFWFFKIVFILFDLGILCVIFGFLKTGKKNARWAALYAFNPLILISFAGQAHLDSIMVFFMCASVLTYMHKRWYLMFFRMALAFQAKYMAVMILPFMLKRENLKYSWMFMVTALAPFIPCIFNEFNHTFDSLFTFGTAMAHNGSIHGLFRVITGSIESATIICAILFLLFYVYILIDRKSGILWKGILCLAGFILLSPTIHLWYIAWIIPFICFYPSWSWSMLCMSISLYFTADKLYFETGVWRQPVFIQVLQWIPFYIILGYEIVKHFKHRKNPMCNLPAKTLGIIIPTLNSEKFLPECLEHVSNLSPSPDDVIVIDGGSSDKTVTIAQSFNTTTISSSKGRGNQIAEGVKSCNTDLVLVLHSDTFLKPDTIKTVKSSFKTSPEIIGGSLGQRFTESSFSLSLIEILNDMRASLFGISFGDQVQFFRTKPVKEYGLVPPIPLMEDVELSIRLGKYGKRTFLWESAMVSNYKWKSGFFKRVNKVIYLLLSFFNQKIRGNLKTDKLYKSYYG